MKSCFYLFCMLIVALLACSQRNQTVSSAPATGKVGTQRDTNAGGLTVIMESAPDFNAGDPLMIRFTVTNNSDTPSRFCKWHTPFERLSSNYLEIKNEKGEEAAYQGILARRVMPPPEDSYITLQPGQHLTSEVNLREGYAITQPGIYTLTYLGGNISGLTTSNRLSFRLH